MNKSASRTVGILQWTIPSRCHLHYLLFEIVSKVNPHLSLNQSQMSFSDIHLIFLYEDGFFFQIKKELLTLIGKFLGHFSDRFTGKLIHQKILTTYSVFLETGLWPRPFYWKTHPIVNWTILGRHDASHRTFYWKTHPKERI